MEWFIFLVVVIWIGYRFSGSKNCQRDRSNNNVGDQFASKKENDDFAGGSVGALFLMEEFIDPHLDEQEFSNQGLIQSERGEEDYFEDEFLE